MKCEPLTKPVYILSGGVTGQFTAPPSTCPGGTFTFRCTVGGAMTGTTVWRVNGSSSSSTNLYALSHLATGAANTCMPSGASHPFTATPESGFGSSGPFTSTLSAPADPVLDGTLVECFDSTLDSENRVGKYTIQIVGQ